MKKCAFVLISALMLSSATLCAAQGPFDPVIPITPLSPGPTAIKLPHGFVRIFSGGQFRLVKVPGAVKALPPDGGPWLMQPLLPPGAIRAVIKGHTTLVRAAPPISAMAAQSKKSPVYDPFCVPVNPKNFSIAVAAVNPDIDSMGNAHHIGNPRHAVPSRLQPMIVPRHFRITPPFGIATKITPLTKEAHMPAVRAH
jgi:hypothetical protein